MMDINCLNSALCLNFVPVVFNFSFILTGHLEGHSSSAFREVSMLLSCVACSLLLPLGTMSELGVGEGFGRLAAELLDLLLLFLVGFLFCLIIFCFLFLVSFSFTFLHF